MPYLTFARFYGVMPGYSEQDDALVTKVVSFFPNNKTVSTHNAVLVVMDASNGIPTAVSYTLHFSALLCTFNVMG